jgi:hypothetical protein
VLPDRHQLLRVIRVVHLLVSVIVVNGDMLLHEREKLTAATRADFPTYREPRATRVKAPTLCLASGAYLFLRRR